MRPTGRRLGVLTTRIEVKFTLLNAQRLVRREGDAGSFASRPFNHQSGSLAWTSWEVAAYARSPPYPRIGDRWRY